MNRKTLTLLFISFISVCLVIGFLGRIAMAAQEPSRSAKAYQENYTCAGGMCTYTGTQYTSQYDLMMGNIFPNVTVQYSRPDWGGMMTGSASSSSRGSAVGGLFTGPMMSYPVSPMSYYMGAQGAPRYETYDSVSPWFGSTSYSSMYQGLGFQGSGFNPGLIGFNILGGLWGGGGGWGGGGWGGGWGYPGAGLTGYQTGGFPTRLY